MPQSTQFADVFNQRVAALNGRNPVSRQQRWVIWLRQDDEQQRICFATSARDICEERSCHHRDECVNLQAEWLR